VLGFGNVDEQQIRRGIRIIAKATREPAVRLSA